MIRINCPFCGVRDHSEFAYGGDASIVFPSLDASTEAWIEAVFQRENIDGIQLETWHHIHGCRMWVIVMRDTVTHEICSVEPAHEGIRRVLEAALETPTSVEKGQEL